MTAESIIDSHSWAHGNSIVENSILQENSVVSDTVELKNVLLLGNCHISGSATVENSDLRRVKMSSGDIFSSTLVAENGRLNVKGDLSLHNSTLIIHDPHPVLKKKTEIRRVIAEELEVFRLFGTCVLLGLSFEKGTRLVVEAEETKGDRAIIHAKFGKSDLGMLDLIIRATEIYGEFRLAGKVTMNYCRLLGNVSVTNDGEGALSLCSTSLMEFSASIKNLTRSIRHLDACY